MKPAKLYGLVIVPAAIFFSAIEIRAEVEARRDEITACLLTGIMAGALWPASIPFFVANRCLPKPNFARPISFD